ncbi:spondin domain-containing protein [Akkermansiaceae bacterium]|nr:spondin domain-containing protein [Akkermansiaceae bacterium]
MKITTTTSIIVSLSALISSANGASLRITVEASSNVGLAPALLSFHNGSVDFFDTGSAASAGLELLAEVGDTSVLQASLAAGSDNITIANGVDAELAAVNDRRYRRGVAHHLSRPAGFSAEGRNSRSHAGFAGCGRCGGDGLGEDNAAA